MVFEALHPDPINKIFQNIPRQKVIIYVYQLQIKIKIQKRMECCLLIVQNLYCNQCVYCLYKGVGINFIHLLDILILLVPSVLCRVMGKQTKKACEMFSFLPVSEACTNKFHIL
jgi:Na+/citrate or Na+/malate symporter